MNLLRFLSTILFLSLLLIFNNESKAQSHVEFSLGNGYYLVYSPPSGWTEGSGFGNEKCWNAKAYKGRLCIKTEWKRNRTAEQILKDKFSDITFVSSTTDEIVTDQFKTVVKHGKVKTPSRTEGRGFFVSFYFQEETMNALVYAVHVYEDGVFEEVVKSFEKIQIKHVPK